ncbi:class I SAM-dependent methyltransferase [Geomonas agri]|uniref:class I SAM-dependent methyltransferase n=1 Tax=Geomonas agri TaxID=2873702 RepID=UPI001CD4812A|nr:class I SAM-dependent methyltransferase [Geomonas agri]
MNIGAIKAALPWWTKILLKLCIARFPTDYRLWQKLDIFKHGAMEAPEYAYRIFKMHYDRSNFPKKSEDFVCLEVGPGDSLFSCIIAKLHGASLTYMVDSGFFATHEIAPYSNLFAFLRNNNFNITRPEPFSVPELVEEFGGHYLTEGLAAIASIPSASIDFIWSNAVLEHIRKPEFLPFMKELRRILKDDGICSHRIDLRDHLGGGLNNLRFSEEVWESDMFAKSGFYTNRIRFHEMCSIFNTAGFEVSVLDINKWEKLPSPYSKFDKTFKSIPEHDLLISGFDVLLYPKAYKVDDKVSYSL